MGIRIAVYEGTRSLRMLRKEQLSGLLVGVMPTSTLLHRDSSAGKQELTQRCPVVPDLSRKAPFCEGAAALNLFLERHEGQQSVRPGGQLNTVSTLRFYLFVNGFIVPNTQPPSLRRKALCIARTIPSGDSSSRQR